MKTYTIPTPVADALAAAGGALDARKAVDAALAQCAVQRTEAEAAVTAADTALAEADAQAMLHPGAGTEKAAAGALGRRNEAGEALARLARTAVALEDQARRADAAIATARTALEAAARDFQAALAAELDAELRAAVRPLVGVVLKAHAICAAANMRAFADLKDELHIPAALGGSRAPVIRNGKFLDTVDGDGIALAAAWPEDAAAAALAGALKPLGDTRKRLAAHRPYAPPAPPAPPYVRKGWEVGTPASRAPEPAVPPARFIPSSWTGRR